MKKLGRFLLWVLLLVEPLAVGLLAFFIIGPKLSDTVGGLVTIAVLLHAFCAFAAARAVFGPKGQGPTLAVWLVSVLLYCGAGWALFFNRPPPFEAPVPDRGVRFSATKVKSGSILAVAKLGANAGGAPVVFLHGGPGRPVTPADAAFFQSLAEKDVDVVLFDQAGVGESAPLPREEITLERAVADVEALREALGAEKISIFGQSWGGRLAVEYAARHPDRVHRLAVSGGAPIGADPTHWKFESRRTALKEDPSPLSFRLFLAALVLDKVNPKLSQRFATKGDLNAAMAAVVPSIMKRSVCAKDGEAVSKPPELGGIDGTQFLYFRPQIEGVAAPEVKSPPETLILRPQCDFASWAVAKDYRDRLKGKVVYLEGAGHAVWPYRGEVARDVLAAFFHGEELPLPVYEGDKDPAGE